MTKQEADFIGSMNMCDEISNEAYKKIICHCDVEESQPCEDAVSRQKVLQCIKESREGIDWGQSEDEDAFLHYSAALYRTIASKECLPSVTPKTEWIPVSERLPKEDGMYLISTCMNCIDTCLFYKDDDEYLWVDYEDSVIAWMPLPSSYQGE